MTLDILQMLKVMMAFGAVVVMGLSDILCKRCFIHS